MFEPTLGDRVYVFISFDMPWKLMKLCNLKGNCSSPTGLAQSVEHETLKLTWRYVFQGRSFEPHVFR